MSRNRLSSRETAAVSGVARGDAEARGLAFRVEREAGGLRAMDAQVFLVAVAKRASRASR